MREAIKKLSQSTGELTWIDRRIDPNLRVSLDAKSATHAEVLEELSTKYDFGYTRVGGLFYFCPKDTSQELRTIVELRGQEASTLNNQGRSVFRRRAGVQWDRLATPRDILGDLATENGILISNLQEVPHDLWESAKLPPLSLTARLSVLLAGFNSTFAIHDSGTKITIVPIERPVAITRRFPVQDSKELFSSLKQLFPDSQFEVDGRSLRVFGRVEDMEQLQRVLTRPKRELKSRPASRETKQVYTLQVRDQPLDALISQLGRKLSFQAIWDDAAVKKSGLSPQQRVSFSVRSANLDQLMTAALQPAGFDFNWRDGNLFIFPAISD